MLGWETKRLLGKCAKIVVLLMHAVFDVGFRDFKLKGSFSILLESEEVNISNLEINEI